MSKSLDEEVGAGGAGGAHYRSPVTAYNCVPKSYFVLKEDAPQAYAGTQLFVSGGGG